MTIAWVIGSGGLLGSALCRMSRRTETILFKPSERFHWNSETELIDQLAAEVKAFAAYLNSDSRWEIYWAAGVGTMSSTESELVVETRVLTKLIELVDSEPSLISKRGAFVFASSAGAIYAGSLDDVITEDTVPSPSTAYARAKLEQENLVKQFALQNRHVTALIARVSTLYGPGQATGKQQGLIAHISRCILRNQPIQIYVPFDTIRDYITTDDAAAEIVATLRNLETGTGAITKIIASEQPVTIAEIISIYKRISRRPPRIITSANKLSSLYSKRVRFCSKTAVANKSAPRTSLFVGIAQVLAAERSAFICNKIKL